MPAARRRRLSRPAGWLAALWVALLLPALAAAAAPRWVGTWSTAPMAEPAAKEAMPLADATLRQVVRVSLGGSAVRIRLSNAFGATPLVLHGVHVAVAGADGAIRPETDREVRFSGAAAVSVPAGAAYLSDPVALPVAAQADLAITLHLASAPETLTMHGGSRTTSYLQAGGALAAPALPEAKRFVRWYFINGVEVETRERDAAAIVLLGDSITDGYGTKPDTNQRIGDHLVRRLAALRSAPAWAVLNAGIGGGRLLRDGNGPNALARFERDVLGQTGARWLVVFIGINDIGTRIEAQKKGAPYASADDLIAGYRQLIARARARGLKVIGATITPYRGADFYWSEDGEADRQKVNGWIRSGGEFDAVIDFDAITRDPADPQRLAAACDSGDHLHPSVDGYARMAQAIDLRLFRP